MRRRDQQKMDALRKVAEEKEMSLNKIYFIHCFFRHIKYRRFNKAKSRTNESAMNKAVTLYNKGMVNTVSMCVFA